MKKFEVENMDFSHLRMLIKLVEIEPTEFRKFQLANCYRLCGFFTKGEEVYKEINIKNIPEEYQSLYFVYLGSLYIDMGKDHLAIRCLKKSIKLGHTDTIPYIYLSLLYSKKELINESIEILEKGLSKEGDIDEIYYNLATRYAMLGDYRKALKMINECLRLDSNYPNAFELKKDIKQCIKISMM